LHGHATHNGRFKFRSCIQADRSDGFASCGTFARDAVGASARKQAWMSINSKAFQ
jgi:hypothetical protein